MKISRKASTILSFVFLGILSIGIIIALFMIPQIMDYFKENFKINRDMQNPAIYLLYAAGITGLTSVFFLFNLLMNVARNLIFTDGSVFCLRAVSWCCIIAGILFGILSLYWLIFLLGAFGAVFMGVMLRVVKNVIEEAVSIKNENDFTI